MDWFDLLAVQGILKSLLQHHNLKTSLLLPLGFLSGFSFPSASQSSFPTWWYWWYYQVSRCPRLKARVSSLSHPQTAPWTHLSHPSIPFYHFLSSLLLPDTDSHQVLPRPSGWGLWFQLLPQLHLEPLNPPLAPSASSSLLLDQAPAQLKRPEFKCLFGWQVAFITSNQLETSTLAHLCHMLWIVGTISFKIFCKTQHDSG